MIETNPFVRLLLILPVLLTPVANASNGGVESLRQTGKAFASGARTVSPSVVFIFGGIHSGRG
jgi:serine protease Do